MNYVFLGLFLLSILLAIAMLWTGRNQNTSIYSLVYISITVSCGGYTMIAFADSPGWALCGNAVAYFGIYFAMLFVLILTTKLAHVNFPPVAFLLLVAVNTTMVLVVASVPWNGLYYKEYRIVRSLGASYIKVSRFGPLHKIHYAILGLYFLLSIGIFFYALVRGRKLSVKHIVLISVIEYSMMMIYLLNNIFLQDLDIELVPFSMVLCECGILCIIWDLGMYEVSGHILHTLSKRLDHGYIILDTHMRFITCDDQAMEFCPEINSLRVDHRVDKYNKDFADLLSKWIKDQDQVYIPQHSDGIKVRVVTTNICRFSRVKGYLIELYDDTIRIDYAAALDTANRQLNERVVKEVARLSYVQSQLILGLATMVEKRDHTTGSHIFRTSSVVNILISHMKYHPDYAHLPESYWSCVIETAPLHDIGKIAISDAILCKPGRFTPEELLQMQTHPLEGARIITEILESVNDPAYTRTAKNIALHHHERWDGSGYPDRLQGDAIPLEARIMALADVLDALVSPRSYKKAFPFDLAAEQIENAFGTHYDPALKPFFEDAKDELEAFYKREIQSENRST